MVDLSKIDISPAALAKFAAVRDLLVSKYPVKPGLLKRIYYHWTAAPHGAEFSDYNLEVVYKEGNYRIDVTHNPQDNAPGLNNNTMASHTLHRNTGAIGISIDGMDGAGIHDFGPDPLSQTELLHLCGAGAAAAKAYGIDLSAKVDGENVILTHAECATLGDPLTGFEKYPSERWDLGCLDPLPFDKPLTDAMRFASGDQLRALTRRIKILL